MGLGLEVNKATVNMKSAQAVLEMRSALEKTEAIAKWLGNQPVVNAVDPLIAEFGFTVDEAYILRLYFESVDAIRTNNITLFDTGRKMTGLE